MAASARDGPRRAREGLPTENYSTYVPDLPGCVASGNTIEEVEEQIREAIAFHLEGLREDGISVPPPSSYVEYVGIAA